MKDISPAELARLIKDGMQVAMANESVEFGRMPTGNARIVTFDVRLSNEQVFTVRVEEVY